MDFLFALGQLIVGFTILLFGGELLVRSAVSIAARANLSPAVIGLTIIAAGTSAPELGTSLLASLQGAPDIALGNVIGSNIFNLLAILGISALIRTNRVEPSMAKIELPLLIGFTGLVIYFVNDLTITQLEGALCILALFLLFGFSIIRATRMGYQAPVDEPIAVLKNWIWDSWYLVAGIAALMGGSYLALEGGVAVGEMIGLSQRVIGITIISVGTGLPELATSAVAAYRGRDDIAVSNIIGSNIINTLGIIGVASIFKPINVSAQIAHFDAWVMLAITTLMLPIILVGKFRLRKQMGVVLLLGYAIYIYFLLQR